MTSSSSPSASPNNPAQNGVRPWLSPSTGTTRRLRTFSYRPHIVDHRQPQRDLPLWRLRPARLAGGRPSKAFARPNHIFHAAVPGVGDIDVARTIHGDAERGMEMAITWLSPLGNVNVGPPLAGGGRDGSTAGRGRPHRDGESDQASQHRQGDHPRDWARVWAESVAHRSLSKTHAYCSRAPVRPRPSTLSGRIERLSEPSTRPSPAHLSRQQRIAPGGLGQWRVSRD